MLLDYELVISCALAAVAILRIIDQRRRMLRLRERLRSVRTGMEPSHDAAATKQGGARASQDLHDERMGHFGDRLVVLLLVLALLWFGGRIWMEA